mgnify:CR=1 FL=1
MFCEECGTKNEKDAAFCEKCGHKLKTVKTTTKVVKKETKPMSKKQKTTIGIVAVVAVILIGVYMFIGSTLKPEKIALKYFKAYANKDANALVSTISLEESDFVSKKLLKESLKDEDKISLANYSAEKEEKNDNLSTSVTIKYVEKGSSKEKTKTVRLTKNKKKKWLFFDNWTVDSSELIAKDYTITVPVGSTLKIDGVEVKDKYKKDSYSSYYDYYSIPSILKGSYTVTAELKSGIKLSGDLKVNGSYGSFSANSLKLEEKTEEKLTKDITDKLNKLYESAIEDKSYDDVKSVFDEDYQDDFEYTYNQLKENALSSYNKLKEFKLTDVNIKSISLDDEEVSLTVQIKYDYKVEYESGDESKEHSKKGKMDTIYVTYKLEKKDYVMSELRSLVSYFSHYSY